MIKRRFLLNENIFNPNKYLTIVALEDGLDILCYGGIYYKVEDGDWVFLEPMTKSNKINKGECLFIKSNWIMNPTVQDGNSGVFKISKKCNLKGNCLSLLFGDNADKVDDTTELPTHIFDRLFAFCTTINEVSSSFLPSKIMSVGCYFTMFQGCSSLTTAPALPATILADECYYYMFDGCTSLTSAPALPATTLASSCYRGMFYDCSGLTTAPALPATTLASSCYQHMFHGCSKLNYIKMLATDISASYCLSVWVLGVASTGTFVKNPDATWEVYGNSGIPNGWTVVMDGEEDVGGGFTANFFFDYCEDFGFYKQCERAPDDLGVACHNEAARLMELYGVESGHYYTSVDNPQRYGFNVTIEGAQVIEISKEYDTLFLHTGGEYQIVSIDRNGLIIYEL